MVLGNYVKSKEISSTVPDGAASVKLHFVGGIVGVNLENQIIDHCSNTGNMSGCVGIGGIVGAALLGAIYGMIFDLDIRGCVILCAAGGAVSQIGDLAASAIKRNHNIKDYGHLIPGHGGILDRFDSVIFTAPIIYALTLLVFSR